MQSFLQHRRIYKQLERQFVVKHDDPDNVWTHERHYWYGEGRVHSQDREPDIGAPASRRREHGQRTPISGPALEPHHTTRSHLERDGDVERADYDPEFQADPWTINTRDSLGGGSDIMVTGVERYWRRGREVDGEEVDGAADGTEKGNKMIVVTFEGDTDPMDPHNWSFTRRVLVTLLLSLLGAIILWSSTIDAAALTATKKLFQTSFELQTVPTGGLLFICYKDYLLNRCNPSSFPDLSRRGWLGDGAHFRSRRPQSHVSNMSPTVYTLQYGRRSFPKHITAYRLPSSGRFFLVPLCSCARQLPSSISGR